MVALIHGGRLFINVDGIQANSKNTQQHGASVNIIRKPSMLRIFIFIDLRKKRKRKENNN